jgi:hypothetical protein
MRRLFRRARDEDRGAALALVAGSLVVLMGMAAFGTDLGWFYLNASRVQRAADAAALGGVVWMPADPSAAEATAFDIAMRNGFDDADANITVDPEEIPGAPNELEVTVESVVPTFFARILGFDEMTISRTARAEYIPPLKLGSPSNKFGNDPSCYGSDVDCAGNFWANIHGRNTDTHMGDAYASFCRDESGSTNGCPESPAYRDTGYLYGVIPHGSGFTLETLDMAFHNESGGIPNADAWRTGDHNDFCPNGPACVGPTVTVNIFLPDPTPLILTDNGAPVCSKVYTPQAQIDPDSDPPFNGPPPPNWTWDSACSVDTSASPEGIWVVQVVNSSTNVNTSALNRYSVRTSGSSNLFGLGDFSMFNNSTATESNFHLAEVPDYYAGKTFVVELYDPGDSNAGGDIKLMPPGSSVPYGSCEMFTRAEVTDTWTSRGTRSPCQFTALNNGGANDYNGEWVKLEATLPAPGSYSGGWWKIHYTFVGGVQDTTTWLAYMIGNPIHLIPAP